MFKIIKRALGKWSKRCDDIQKKLGNKKSLFLLLAVNYGSFSIAGFITFLNPNLIALRLFYTAIFTFIGFYEVGGEIISK